MAPSAIEIEYITEDSSVHNSNEHNIEENVAFGGEDQWFYNVKSKRFDLSRGSRRKLILDADDGIRNHRGVEIDPSKTVLVIVDMQNYFIHPKYRDHSGGLDAIIPLMRVINRCRKLGIQLVWLNWGIDGKDLKEMPAAVQRGFNTSLIIQNGHGWHVGLGADLGDDEGRCLWKGSWNAEVYPPLKDLMIDEDLSFDKARMSGLWSPELPFHKYLRESGKKTLLFAGVVSFSQILLLFNHKLILVQNVDQCLLGTLTDAYNWGWDCLLLSDCAATMTGLGAEALCEYNIS